jgi:Uma2 family endonuclease
MLSHMPRSGFTKPAATYADLEALPHNIVGEILDGELYASPRPAARHALAASAMGTEIGGPFHQGRGGPGGWWILFEPELHLGNDVLVPDFAGWRRSRMPVVPTTAAFDLAPDWVCEVLSPSTEAMDRVPKLRIYARERVGHVWFVNPQSETLEVLRWERGAWVVAGVYDGNAVVRAEPFDAVEVELFRLWGRDTASG